MNPDFYYDPPEPVHEWEDDAYCPQCDDDTEHLYIEWRDGDHVVTRECSKCGDVVEIEDDE